MAPPEYRLSQDVLIFLIENQDSFLIGMQGTAADAETVKDVQTGTPTKSPGSPSTPGRSKTIIGRSSSNASAGVESLRKPTDVRRNLSVSSKQSKRSDGVVAPGMSPSTSVHRSNTVPSRRDGSNANSPRITNEKIAETTEDASAVAVDTSKPRQESLQSTPIATAPPQFPASNEGSLTEPAEVSTSIGSDSNASAGHASQTPNTDMAPLIAPAASSVEPVTERSPTQTPTASSGRFLDIFKQSPPGQEDGRKPHKLQKRRMPGTSLSSAQSSNNSLGHEEQQEAAQQSPVFPVAAGLVGSQVDNSGVSPTTPTAPRPVENQEGQVAPQNVQAGLAVPPRNMSADHSLRPQISPAHSYRSGTESDAEMVGDDMSKEQAAEQGRERRRHRWRFSRSQNKFETSPGPSPNPLGTMTGKESTMSRSTVGSSGGRKSFHDPMPLASSATDPVMGGFAQGQTFSSSSTEPVFSDSEKEKKSGPMSWIRGKMGGSKDKEGEKRSRTPDRYREQREQRSESQLPTEALPVRGASVEAQRSNVETSPPVAPVSAPALDTSPDALAAAQAAPASAPVVGSNEDSTSQTAIPITSESNGSAPHNGQTIETAATESLN